MGFNFAAKVSLTLATGSLAASLAWAQADPEWLRSWNEAVASQPATLSASGTIASAHEPGEPMVIRGQVVNPDGSAAAGVIVHAYHRDEDGFEFGVGDRELSMWELQGWVQTDTEGRFEFQTTKPAADHMGREGAHVHFTLISEEYGRQWARTVYLADDPLVGARQRRESQHAGDFGWVVDVSEVEGVQHINVKFRLRETADF